MSTLFALLKVVFNGILFIVAARYLMGLLGILGW